LLNDHAKDKWSTVHRPWPLPRLPWVMEQSWNQSLFIHYPIRLDVLRQLVPSQLSLDSYDGWGWIGLVAFDMENVKFRGLPAFAKFPELNVRTYVTLNDKPGVYFFSLDATHLPMVTFARIFCNLPYHHASIDKKQKGDLHHFRSCRKKNHSIVLDCTYHATSEPYLAKTGSFDEWLTERYCFYTTSVKGKIIRCDVLHLAWPLQQAEADIHENNILLGIGIQVEQVTPVLHYSKGVDVRIWPLLHA